VATSLSPSTRAKRGTGRSFHFCTVLLARNQIAARQVQHVSDKLRANASYLSGEGLAHQGAERLLLFGWIDCDRAWCLLQHAEA